MLSLKTLKSSKENWKEPSKGGGVIIIICKGGRGMGGGFWKDHLVFTV